MLDKSSNGSSNNEAFLHTSGGAVCDLARSNVLNFTDAGSMHAWVYPQDAGITIDLQWCVLGFFALSFVFQIAVTLASFGQYGYTTIFSKKYVDSSSGELSFHDAFVAHALLLDAEEGNGRGRRRQKKNDQDMEMWCTAMLAFNWLRFIEYSISGSLVLATIALISGVMDLELLLCLFTLSFACMLMGLGAEFAMRGRSALQPLAEEATYKQFGISDEARRVLEIIRKQLLIASIVLHVVAWLCIFLPWYIVFMHYKGWWEPCSYPGLSLGAPQPPDFVKAIVFAQIFLFLLFGVVQAVQFWFPHKRRIAEVSYITLSLTAKVMLGATIAANILLT